MECVACQVQMSSSKTPEVVKRVKKEYEEYISICPRCFDIVQLDRIEKFVELNSIDQELPKGEMGIVIAIGIGWLMQSLILNKKEIVSLFEYVIEEGKDPWIILERLSISSNTNVKKSINKSRLQLEQLIR